MKPRVMEEGIELLSLFVVVIILRYSQSHIRNGTFAEGRIIVIGFNFSTFLQ